ncbi:hypothetical protein ACLOJK_027044, partial [Asimina triloba]
MGPRGGAGAIPVLAARHRGPSGRRTGGWALQGSIADVFSSMNHVYLNVFYPPLVSTGTRRSIYFTALLPLVKFRILFPNTSTCRPPVTYMYYTGRLEVYNENFLGFAFGMNLKTMQDVKNYPTYLEEFVYGKRILAIPDDCSFVLMKHTGPPSQ